MRVLLNDPPREKAEGNSGFVGLDDIARESDIITFHTPSSGSLTNTRRGIFAGATF